VREVSYRDIVQQFHPSPKNTAGAYLLVKRVAVEQLSFLDDRVARQWLYLAAKWFWRFVAPTLLPSAQRDISVLARIIPRFKLFLSETDYDLDRAFAKIE